ncbi:hypothetical protein BJ138DRAFT_1128518 [Hygrophoropsis aurantiaca]|uniref:Uncharacterized protein n=1 Tax=Hygrophoropsis aurantiaca TaxID=72124 RepID=A0ACB8A5P7_9AGAM|nr:hypothetical protein BJ138DRAFT_1128518 [Hygrophoropsis aurantiaca]
MEDISNTSSSTSNLTYTDWMDMLRFMFADNISSGPNGLGNGEDYNSNSGTQQERPLDHGDATLDDLNDPFTWDFGNESLSAGSQSAIDYFNGNSAESWNNGGSQWAYEDRPHSHPSQGEHINVDTAAPRDLQLVPDQHLLAQNSGDSPAEALMRQADPDDEESNFKAPQREA